MPAATSDLRTKTSAAIKAFTWLTLPQHRDLAVWITDRLVRWEYWSGKDPRKCDGQTTLGMRERQIFRTVSPVSGPQTVRSLSLPKPGRFIESKVLDTRSLLSEALRIQHLLTEIALGLSVRPCGHKLVTRMSLYLCTKHSMGMVVPVYRGT